MTTTVQGYVGDGETLPTTPEEALDLLSGYIDDPIEPRPDIDRAFWLLSQLVGEFPTESEHPRGHSWQVMCPSCLSEPDVEDAMGVCPERALDEDYT